MRTAGPAHARIATAVLARWPRHGVNLERAVPDDLRMKELAEQLSRLILSIVGDDLDRFVDGYLWMCEMLMEEELNFRRTGCYRYATFDEVGQSVYGDSELMGRYMDGVLFSQVLWANHLASMAFYLDTVLPSLRGSSAHLEIGPGHGLLLWHATGVVQGEVRAWDVSPTSLQRTRAALDRLGAGAVALERRDLLADENDGRRFDSVVLSEVLEHLEAPATALRIIHGRMTPGGLLYVNAPVNSPSIDHIYLFRAPEEVVSTVAAAGFQVLASQYSPATGLTEERARQTASTISCAILARRSP